jgi:acetyl esterase/lipase
VIVIHGESWDNGRELGALDAYLATRDYVVANVRDPLPAGSPFPRTRNDLVAMLRYLKAHAAEFGLDPTRLAIVGRSIGGHVALLVAYSTNDPAIRGVVSLYAPTDLSALYADSTQAGLFDTRSLLSGYLGGSPDYQEDAYHDASPINFVRRGGPATLLVHGMRDEIVPPEQSERLAMRLEQEGVRHLLVRLPWAAHGCERNFSGPCGQITTYAVERFLNAVMAGTAAPAPRGRLASQRNAKRTTLTPEQEVE